MSPPLSVESLGPSAPVPCPLRTTGLLSPVVFKVLLAMVVSCQHSIRRKRCAIGSAAAMHFSDTAVALRLILLRTDNLRAERPMRACSLLLSIALSAGIGFHANAAEIGQ